MVVCGEKEGGRWGRTRGDWGDTLFPSSDYLEPGPILHALGLKE